MQYIKLDNDTWVEVNTQQNTSQIVKKTSLEEEVARLQGQLEKLPVSLSDEEKIVWYESHVNEEANEQSRLLISAEIEAVQQKISMLI